MGTKVTNFRNILSIMTLKKLKIFSFVAFAELHKDIRTDVQMFYNGNRTERQRDNFIPTDYADL